MKNIIGSAQFFAITVDKVSVVDNFSYVAVHCYVVHNWIRVPMFVLL